MFKNRLFLYGLGLGLIAGAIMLQLMFKVDEMERRPTMEQLQAQADKLNYKVFPKDQPVYSDKEIEAIKQKAAEEERNKLARQTSAPAPAPTNAPPAQAVAKTVKTVYISERMDASQVADMLVKAGVVPDTAGLVTALDQKKLSTRIRPGSYSFEDQSSVDDVIAKITIQ